MYAGYGVTLVISTVLRVSDGVLTQLREAGESVDLPDWLKPSDYMNAIECSYDATFIQAIEENGVTGIETRLEIEYCIRGCTQETFRQIIERYELQIDFNETSLHPEQMYVGFSRDTGVTRIVLTLQ